MKSGFGYWLGQALRLAVRGQWRDALRAVGRAFGAKPAVVAAPAQAEPVSPVADLSTAAPPAAQPLVAPPAPRTRNGGKVLAGEFVHSQGSRDYLLFVPSRWRGQRFPLLLMLHGCTQDPEDFARGTRMNVLAQEQGMLVLYPAQTGSANPARCWNWFSRMHQKRIVGEPALLAALTQSVIETYGVDPQRVYVAGLSAGAAMAVVLGQTWPDVYAAVGVHSGLAFGAAGDVMAALSVMRNGPDLAEPAAQITPPLPVIVFHGDADSTVHPENGAQVIAAALGGTQVPVEVVQGASATGQTYTRSRYASGANGFSAEHWLLHGAGHAWAGGSAEGSFTDPAGPDASREMLRFFLQHPKPLPQ